MAQEKYDIFISYRRRDKEGNEWGTPIARNIQQALESRGYMGRVFFDHNEIGPEDFEEKILGAIKQSKVFICVLTKDAMDNCVREGDPVRREICQAIESEKKMIFLNPDNQFTYNFPVDFPEELRIVRKGNSIDIRMGQKFELDMDDLVKTHIARIIKPSYMIKRTPIVENDESVTVRIKPDLDCRIFNCGDEICVANTGRFTTIQLPLGENELRFEGLECVDDSYEQIIEIDDNRQRIIRVSLLEKYNARKKAERDAYLLSLNDDEFLRFENDGKCGFKLCQSGEIAIPCKYDDVCSFNEGIARVKKEGVWGCIDRSGKEIISLKYEDIWPLSDCWMAVKFNKKWGCVDYRGDEFAICEFDEITLLSDQLIRVKQNGKYGLVNRKGIRVISCEYDEMILFDYGLVKAKINNRYRIIDENGIKVISYEYDSICNFEEGLALVKLNNKYGFIDKTGIEITPQRYAYAEGFKEGLALVYKKNKGWGFINSSGKEIITCQFDDAESFIGRTAIVSLDGEEFYIDKKGNRIKDKLPYRNKVK